MLNTRIYAVLASIIFLFSASTPIFNNDYSEDMVKNKLNNYFTQDTNNYSFQGQSYLNISGPISPNSQINATWYSEITILESYGSDLLPNQSFGLRKQIDIYLGNNDNILNNSEIMDFKELINSSRAWTNAELGGCCIFDYIPFFSQLGNQIIISAPEVGDVNSTNGSWGWVESADIIGFTDNRVTRILHIPRIGSINEQIPLHVSLPKDWEFRYSAMSDLISGSPNNFTVNRSLAPVASNIIISVAENLPPVTSAHRSPQTSSLVSMNKSYIYTGICNDGFLENPQMEWSIIKNEVLIQTFNNPWFEFNPIEHGFTHSEQANILLKCTDSHNFSSSWSEDIIIDSIAPEWSGDVSYNIDGVVIELNIENSVFSVISGSKVKLNISAIDDSSLPVSIELYSNMSDEWRQYHVNEGIFEFYVAQGNNINGLHLNISDRHLPKQPRHIDMALIITDEAGNFIINEWKLIIKDGNPPTILMDIMANDTLVRLDNPARMGNQLKLIFSNSYDDLDSIENTTWQILIDEEIYLETSNWSGEIEKFILPELEIGSHVVSITATDSKGNQKIENYPLIIFPNRGVDLEVISYSISEDSLQTGKALFVLEMKNNFYDDAYARACIEGTCSRFVHYPGADSDTSTIAIMEFEIEMPNTSKVNISIEWDSNSAGENGNFILEYSIQSNENNSTISYLALIIISCLFFFLIFRNTNIFNKNN